MDDLVGPALDGTLAGQVPSRAAYTAFDKQRPFDLIPDGLVDEMGEDNILRPPITQQGGC